VGTSEDDYDEFVRRHGRELWQAVVPIAGPDVADDAVADALTYAWQHWERVRAMDNPAGYLYTMIKRDAMRTRKVAVLPSPTPTELPNFEPGLVDALNELSEMQRQVVYLVEGFGWGLTDTARILEISVSTVRNHLARGMARLRAQLEVEVDA
jgi:RNA polymerase sigma factor (sigma-70 family)